MFFEVFYCAIKRFKRYARMGKLHSDNSSFSSDIKTFRLRGKPIREEYYAFYGAIQRHEVDVAKVATISTNNRSASGPPSSTEVCPDRGRKRREEKNRSGFL